MSRYRPLIDLDVRHAYLDDAPCRSLRFTLDPGSRAALRNAGLLVRASGGGVQVHHDEEHIDALRALATEGTLRLVWRVTSADPAFVAYTRPALMSPERVLYLHSSGDGRERLHGGAYVESDDLVLLTDARLDGLLTAKDHVLPPLAVLDIRVPDSEPRRYHIRFDAPATYWRYYLVGDPVEADHAVVDAADAVGFEALGEVALEGGRRATAFVSSTPIPMRARTARRFQLRGVDSTGDRVLVPQLPVPLAGSLGRDSSGGQERIVSDIYVNW